MTDLCREFGISRQTGYLLDKKVRTLGPLGLGDLSRRPRRSPLKTPEEVVGEILKLRGRYPTWGPKKLKQRLFDLQPEVHWPAASTIGVILKDQGLVKGRKRRRRASPSPTLLRESTAPNQLWCIDFKGQFRLGNGKYCYPLTVTDHYSRFLLGCEALSSTRSHPAEQALELVFRAYGLPEAIRSDNGAPFASTSHRGLSRLSVWLMRLGVELERIQPAHPEQNGRHERMHRTLKQDTTRPAAHNQLQQQERFDTFQRVFNEERPHEALQMKTPKVFYSPSAHPFPDRLSKLTYPLHDLTRLVSHNGSIRMGPAGKLFIGKAFAGQPLGLTQLQPQTWLVSFMDLDIGYLDLEAKRLLPIQAHQPAA